MPSDAWFEARIVELEEVKHLITYGELKTAKAKVDRLISEMYLTNMVVIAEDLGLYDEG